jgi:ribosomal protein S18 acetylase RimI-like enzyme
MAPVMIERARPDQYDDIAALIDDVYVHGGFTGADSPYRDTLRDVAGRATRTPVLVAIGGDGRVVGSVTYAEHGVPDAHVAGPGEAEIRMLAVARDARHHGAGTALVDACIDLARTAGARRVRLSTEPEMTDAHRLYERIGFVRTPERDWSPWPGGTLLAYVLDL